MAVVPNPLTDEELAFADQIAEEFVIGLNPQWVARAVRRPNGKVFIRIAFDIDGTRYPLERIELHPLEFRHGDSQDTRSWVEIAIDDVYAAAVLRLKPVLEAGIQTVPIEDHPPRRRR